MNIHKPLPIFDGMVYCINRTSTDNTLNEIKENRDEE